MMYLFPVENISKLILKIFIKAHAAQKVKNIERENSFKRD